MEAKINEVVQILKTELKNSFNDFEGLYLYGSQVNGIPNEESDIDIVIIIDYSDKQKRGVLWNIISLLEYKYDIFIDVQPMTRQELEHNSIFYDEVVNKGIFYAAA
jgi:predicted nucleotidyltransferase